MAFIENPEINLIESQSCSHTSGFLYIFNSGLTDGKLLQLTEIWNYIYIFKNELWCDIISSHPFNSVVANNNAKSIFFWQQLCAKLS